MTTPTVNEEFDWSKADWSAFMKSVVLSSGTTVIGELVRQNPGDTLPTSITCALPRPRRELTDDAQEEEDLHEDDDM